MNLGKIREIHVLGKSLSETTELRTCVELIRTKRLPGYPHIHRPEGNCKQHANGKYQCITAESSGDSKVKRYNGPKTKTRVLCYMLKFISQPRYRCSLWVGMLFILTSAILFFRFISSCFSWLISNRLLTYTESSRSQWGHIFLFYSIIYLIRDSALWGSVNFPHALRSEIYYGIFAQSKNCEASRDSRF
jgi:hypothetical protein